MTRTTRIVASLCACAAASAALLHAQGRGGGEWTTSGFDAQRSGWLRSDARLTRDALQSGEFKFLWKHTFANEPRQLNALTAPVLLDRLIGFRGFKSLAFVGASDDTIFAIDTDLNRPYWRTTMNYTADTGGQPPSTAECPGGLTAMPSRRTTLAPSAFAGGGFGAGRGGARLASAVGEPGRGAAVLSQAPAQGRGGGRAVQPPAGRGGGRGPAAVPFGGVDPVYAMATDGFLHTLAASNGADQQPAVPFVPPSAKASALLWVDGFVYATTTNGCGGAPNGVWVMDTTKDDKPVRNWSSGGASIAGTDGPALGTTGTIYVATGAAPRVTATRLGTVPRVFASSVVALDHETLEPKDWLTVDGAVFNSSPLVFRQGEREFVAVTSDDGRLFVLDAASLGGANHTTPLAVSAKFTTAGAGTSLATYEAADTRWIVTTSSGGVSGGPAFLANGPVTSGAVVAFKVVDQNGTPALQPGWSSRNLTAPLAPIVIGDMVFAVSSGLARGGDNVTPAQRAQGSTPAVLYVLDAATGKELWNSGKTITSFATSGLSAGGGQVYLVTHDNTLYAFGIPMEH